MTLLSVATLDFISVSRVAIATFKFLIDSSITQISMSFLKLEDICKKNLKTASNSQSAVGDGGSKPRHYGRGFKISDH